MPSVIMNTSFFKQLAVTRIMKSFVYAY